MTEETTTYTPEELARAQQIVADDQAKRAAAQAAKRAAYEQAVRDMLAMPEWTTVRGKIEDMVSNLDPDNQLSIHVTAIDSVMQRLQESVSPLAAGQPA